MSDLLAGVRVLELAALFNGDGAGMYLAGLGADVIKVESPGRGDYLRHFLGQITEGNSPAHLQVNGGKRSIALNLKDPRGLEIFHRLLEGADILIDGYVVGTLAQLGIGHEQLLQRKPDLIYVQATGYGAAGPYAEVPTHGQNMNALAGAISLRKGDDGLVRQVQNADPFGGTSSGGEGTAACAVHAALQAAAALQRRNATGRGCHIDVAGSDAVIANAWIAATYSQNSQRLTDASSLPDDAGGNHTARYQFYETKDRKFLLFCAIEHDFWQRFCTSIGRRDLLEEEWSNRYVEFSDHDEPLRRELQGVFSQRTLQEWMALAQEQAIAMGPANQLADLRQDPHLRERNIFVEGQHPQAGPFTYIGSPAVIDGKLGQAPRPAPALGEQTEEILKELGHSAAEIAALQAQGVVECATIQQQGTSA